jgi:hypothetical protein
MRPCDRTRRAGCGSCDVTRREEPVCGGLVEWGWQCQERELLERPPHLVDARSKLRDHKRLVFGCGHDKAVEEQVQDTGVVDEERKSGGGLGDKKESR